jgi:hypothetical protein
MRPIKTLSTMLALALATLPLSAAPDSDKTEPKVEAEVTTVTPLEGDIAIVAPSETPTTDETLAPDVVMAPSATDRKNGEAAIPAETLADPEVSVEFDKAPVREALATLFRSAGQEYVIDQDVNSKARITLRTRNNRFSNVLNIVTDSAGLHWTLAPGDGKPVYRIQKGAGPQYYVTTPPGATYVVPRDGKDVSLRVWTDGRTPLVLRQDAKGRYLTPDGKELKKDRQGRWILPNGRRVQSLPKSSLRYSVEADAATLSRNALTLRSAPGTALRFYPNTRTRAPLTTYSFTSPSSLWTFTCPHCKGQVTSVRRAADAAKCPTCSRTMATEWQFCPSDGTKRPAARNEWKFCPMCGKTVDLRQPNVARSAPYGYSDLTVRGTGVPLLESLPVVGKLYGTTSADAAANPAKADSAAKAGVDRKPASADVPARPTATGEAAKPADAEPRKEDCAAADAKP